MVFGQQSRPPALMFSFYLGSMPWLGVCLLCLSVFLGHIEEREQYGVGLEDCWPSLTFHRGVGMF